MSNEPPVTTRVAGIPPPDVRGVVKLNVPDAPAAVSVVTVIVPLP
jgi:hypothetical protein